VMEFECEGEADDPGPGDADVMIRRRRVVHGISLERDQSRCGFPLEERTKTKYRGPFPSTSSGSG
jgi:hypothetical protein